MRDNPNLPFDPLPDHRYPAWGVRAALAAICMLAGLVAAACSFGYWGGWL